MLAVDREAIIGALKAVKRFVCAYTPSKGCDCKFGLREDAEPKYEYTGCPELGVVIRVLERMSDEEWTRLQGDQGDSVDMDSRIRQLSDLVSALIRPSTDPEGSWDTTLNSSFDRGVLFALGVLEGRFDDNIRTYEVFKQLEQRNRLLKVQTALLTHGLLQSAKEMEEFMNGFLVEKKDDGEE